MKTTIILSLALILAGCSSQWRQSVTKQYSPLSHDDLLSIRAQLCENNQVSPQAISNVIFTLDELLRDRKDGQAGTRCLACEILARSKSSKAIPILLTALEDPYLKVEFIGMGPERPAELVWCAVWRAADDALREITGADPISQPQQRSPIDGQRESVRKAWVKWWRNNAEQAHKR
jgi:hypothetical protein